MKFLTLLVSTSICCTNSLKIEDTHNTQHHQVIAIQKHDKPTLSVHQPQHKTVIHQRMQRIQKKRVERPELSQDQVDQIKQAFDLFDTNQIGRIYPKQLAAAMQSLGFDTKNPAVFQIIKQLDTPQNAKRGGIEFSDFVEAINNKMNDKQSRDGIRRIFHLFIDDPNQETITLSSLRRIARELGETMSNEQLKQMLDKASSNGTELTFQEFYDIMTKKTF